MKKLLLVSMLCACASAALAQWGDEEMAEKPKFRDRVFTGGGVGASFNSYNDFISVSPLVGVSVTPKLATGVQFIYRYTKYKYSNAPDITTNDFGVSPFLRFQVYGPFFLHGEYEYLNYETYNRNGELVRTGFNSIMAGGGLFQPVGRRAGLFFMALYNFSYQDNSPYASPLVLRAGITAGF
jgi:hypothetical protein